MIVSEYARHSQIPQRVLRLLQREGIIHDPLCREDLLNLQFLEKIWRKKEVLRSQLSRMSMKARLNFLRTADLPSKWERYAYTRFRNREPGKKLTIQTVVEEIETTFCFRLKRQQIQRLYLIRNRAQVARHREKYSSPN
ncbi:MAG: hypothetical protein F9K32_07010 [Desulfobulbaceae bacterium]|nr:MAG: hypothetical protein F9K32_07010 [Desulfobulbaceae bacterium]